MTFEDYLAEAFGVREVAFGTNKEADNGKIETGIGLVTTEMVFKNNRFRIGYSTHDDSVTFTNRNSGGNSTTPVREAKTALDIYNRIAYVLMKVLDYAKADAFRFEGEHDELKNLYIKFIANRSFQNMCRQHGWQYQGEMYEGLYLFKRVKH